MPVATLDLNQNGMADILATTTDGKLVLLEFRGKSSVTLATADCPNAASITHLAVADLNNDARIDIIAASPTSVRIFSGSKNDESPENAASDDKADNGDETFTFSDITTKTPFATTPATATLPIDLDHTGTLDLLTIATDGKLRLFRNDGAFSFTDATSDTGLDAPLPGASNAIACDFNNDETIDFFVARSASPPTLFTNQLLGMVAPFDITPQLPAGHLIAIDDLNNDLRADIVIAAPDALHIVFGGDAGRYTIETKNLSIRALALLDYDNDGWLDIAAAGKTLRLFRNVGFQKFDDVSGDTNIASAMSSIASATSGNPITAIHPADFNGDGTTDLLITTSDRRLHILENRVQNSVVNRLLKMNLVGTRSNYAGLGVLVEIRAGAFRTARTIHRLPIEIGVGNRTLLDSITIVWSDQIVQAEVEVSLSGTDPVTFKEPRVSSASCPYLYAWDGEQFRFITDILGAAPLGLRRDRDTFVDTDPDEYVRIGSSEDFPPIGDRYELRITEELREILYLDSVRLVAIDHPTGTEVHTTDALRPEPIPPSELVTLGIRIPLRHATVDNSSDAGATNVTHTLRSIDDQVVSPQKLRIPQLRGSAEPFSVTLDFGALSTEKPLTLALTGWLQYGGATGNVAASLHPDLPYPWPTLECDTGNNVWLPIDIPPAAPAGKTKTILVDLTGKLPTSAQRLRLTTAFEIHWDRIALFSSTSHNRSTETHLLPTEATLQWHGHGVIPPHPVTLPDRPSYSITTDTPKWRRRPAGFVTRYGDVLDLVSNADDEFAILAGGDEVVLSFDAHRLPPLPQGVTRDFFFYSVGYDKDGDYHVERGRTVLPLPYRDMDHQRYGRGMPELPTKASHRIHNTRYSGSRSSRGSQ